MSNEKKTSLIGSMQLMLAALIWGTAFVAQSVGMDYVGPFTFNGIRNIIGEIVLLPCIFLLRKLQGNKAASAEQTGLFSRETLVGGAVCGVLLFIASTLQQVGIMYTTVGKAGFITAMYILIVPILNMFFGKRIGVKVWIGVFLAVAGLYLLCMTEQLALGKGDAIILACALGFAFQILAVDHFVQRADAVQMACVEFFVCGCLSLIFMAFLEHPTLDSILAAAVPILYAGVLSSGVAYTMQIVGQQKLQPTLASLIMSLESVISALAGWLILGQALSAREMFGAVLMFAAIILAQL